VQGEEKKKREPFRPPSADEVKAYCIEIGDVIDAPAFCDYYESKGWVVGKSPMKDWKSAARRWVKQQKEWGTSPSLPSLSTPIVHHAEETFRFTCPRCGKKGTFEDTIPASFGGYDTPETEGKLCCNCYIDPNAKTVNRKSGAYTLAQIVELE
jgi:hypothetical protein